MINRLRHKLLLIFLLYCGYYVGADPLYDASVLEKAGAYDKALPIYVKWLEENSGDLRFSDILFHSASIAGGVDDSIGMLLNYSDYLSEDDQIKANIEIARLYELTFRYSSAADYYRTASLTGRTKPDPVIHLKYLLLRYQAGEIPVDRDVEAILMSDIPRETYIDALIFKAELLKYRGDWDESERILVQSQYSNLYPEIQYALWELYRLTGNRTEANRIIEYMRSSFPDSVELSLMEDGAFPLPRMSDFFLVSPIETEREFSAEEEPEVNTYIQVGVFTSLSNASALREDLLSAGFESISVSDEGKTKVIVIDIRAVDIVMRELRAKGFQGFRVESP